MSGFDRFDVLGRELVYVNGQILLDPDADLDDPVMFEALKVGQAVNGIFFALALVWCVGGDYNSSIWQFFDDETIDECLALWVVYGDDPRIKWSEEARTLIAQMAAKKDQRAKKAAAEKSRKTSGYVYLLQSPTQYYKIGCTKFPEDRMATFAVKLPFEVEYEHLIETNDMYGLEKELHERFGAKRVNGEWFALDADDIAHIKSL